MLEVPLLVAAEVRLEPLDRRHVPDLAAASADGDVWRKWTTSVPSPDRMADDVERTLSAQAAGTVVPWATCLPDGRAVGRTTYLNLDEANRRLEIGSTWLAPSVQGTAVNSAAKLLQLTRAFDDLGCIAVEFRTHWHNRQSRAAIERLGAKQDGVLRNHRILPDGSYRDTVVYSVVASEWPAVRRGLEARLGRDGGR
ncbi:GNAT family protein [Amnibacterium sp. CER49]|nr:GNAT family protein [Amnibacterium sp. CER49]MDH2443282.1 GNAT family protein [Amnibacterium sp. CER49]